MWPLTIAPQAPGATGRTGRLVPPTRSRLRRSYNRVAPWAGTAHGVLQAVNTAKHHEATIRGASRAERDMLRTVTGGFGDIDRGSWVELSRVLQQV
jgi:hypothetical protein